MTHCMTETAKDFDSRLQVLPKAWRDPNGGSAKPDMLDGHSLTKRQCF